MEPAARVLLPWLPRRRVALGFGEHAVPALLFILSGVVLGPSVLDVITENILAQLDPLVSVALAILGIFIASGLAASRGPRHLVWLAGATVEVLVTLVTTGGAMYLLLARWDPPVPVDAFAAASILAMSVAASAAVGTRPGVSADVSTAAHLADLDDLALLLFGSIAVSALADVPSPFAAMGIAAISGAAIGLAGSLLFARADAPAERGVFVAGIVVLLGGAAAYASASPLLTGFVAGWLWTRRAGTTASLAAADLRKLQHPLVALLLLFAGASMQFSETLLWIASPLVLFRLTGKLAGALLAARLVGVPAGVLATILAPPGVLGIALALNIQQVLGTGDTVLVSAVTLATVVSELLAVALLPRGDET